MANENLPATKRSRIELLAIAEQNRVEVSPDASKEELQTELFRAAVDYNADDALNLNADQLKEYKKTRNAEAKERARVAKEGEENASKAQSGKGVKYFYREGSVGRVLLSVPDNNDATLVEHASFDPYLEKVDGDTVRSGLLATDDKAVIEKVQEIPGVVELSKADFEKKQSSATRVG